MPRSVPKVRVIALRSDDGHCQYVTENCQKYYDPHEFMTYALMEPHQERYVIKEVGINDWDKDDCRWNDISNILTDTLQQNLILIIFICRYYTMRNKFITILVISAIKSSFEIACSRAISSNKNFSVSS